MTDDKPGKGLTKRQHVAERRAKALAMRREGKPYAVIAAALDYGKGGANAASRDVHRALAGAVMEQGRALLTMERERYDALQAILWPLAQAGDVRAARELVRVMERRARLLGLDAAAQTAYAERDTETAKGLLGAFATAAQAAYDALPDAAEN